MLIIDPADHVCADYQVKSRPTTARSQQDNRQLTPRTPTDHTNQTRYDNPTSPHNRHAKKKKSARGGKGNIRRRQAQNRYPQRAWRRLNLGDLRRNSWGATPLQKVVWHPTAYPKKCVRKRASYTTHFLGSGSEPNVVCGAVLFGKQPTAESVSPLVSTHRTFSRSHVLAHDIGFRTLTHIRETPQTNSTTTTRRPYTDATGATLRPTSVGPPARGAARLRRA